MGHLELVAKSPDTEMLLMVNAVPSVLFNVTTFAGLVVCSTMFPNVSVFVLRSCARAVSDAEINANKNTTRWQSLLIGICLLIDVLNQNFSSSSRSDCYLRTQGNFG